MKRRINTQRNTNSPRENQSADAQQKSCPKSSPHQFENWNSIAERVPEITCKNITQPFEILYKYILIKPKLTFENGDLLPRNGRVQSVCIQKISRGSGYNHEGQYRDPKQDGNCKNQPSNYIFQHLIPSSIL